MIGFIWAPQHWQIQFWYSQDQNYRIIPFSARPIYKILNRQSPYSVITVPADVLAPNDTRPSARMLEKLKMFSSKFLWFSMISMIWTYFYGPNDISQQDWRWNADKPSAALDPYIPTWLTTLPANQTCQLLIFFLNIGRKLWKVVQSQVELMKTNFKFEAPILWFFKYK